MNLHIAISLRIVGKHKGIPKISVYQARDVIRQLAVERFTLDEQLLAKELEEATGLPTAELAKRTDKWLPTG